MTRGGVPKKHETSKKCEFARNVALVVPANREDLHDSPGAT